MIDIRQLLKSFRYAIRGVVRVAAEEQNFRVHILAAVLVILAAFWLGLEGVEIAILTLVVVLVLVLELVNSVFERMVDLLKPRVHDFVKDVKDVMAAAVLLASIGALLIGGLIFWPHVVALLR
jgi:diacylglycerol kinase